jgi:hypothetical protein
VSRLLFQPVLLVLLAAAIVLALAFLNGVLGFLRSLLFS